MTVFVKPSIIAAKSESMAIPLVHEDCISEAKVAMVSPEPPAASSIRRTINRVFLVMNISLLLLMFSAIGLVAYRTYSRVPYHRYQGYCAIPIDIRLENVEMLEQPNGVRLMPLEWTSEPDVEIISDDDEAAQRLVHVLREQLDIDGSVEKISVLNNGHQVSFIHDFSANVTNIVDTDRCFSMELDTELVMMPDAFVLSIEKGEQFDLSRVRSALRALLPAVHDLAAVPEQCRSRPNYRLHPVDHDDNTIQKRSADAPPKEYVHFSGKHLYQIEIGNMDELLNYEKNATA